MDFTWLNRIPDEHWLLANDGLMLIVNEADIRQRSGVLSHEDWRDAFEAWASDQSRKYVQMPTREPREMKVIITAARRNDGCRTT